MSGVPGVFLGCERNPRSPDAKSTRRNINSGFVFFALFALITRETVSLFGIGERASLVYLFVMLQVHFEHTSH